MDGLGVLASFDADLSTLSSAELMGVLRAAEVQRRKLAAFDARLLAEIRDRGVAAEWCRSSVADLLVAELLIAPGEARARTALAEVLAPRVTLSGERVEPRLPRAALALGEGEISLGHLAVIARAVERIPAALALEACSAVEDVLVDAARHEHPRELERTARMLHARLDPDGPEPDERPLRPSFSVSTRSLGWASARGTLDPATAAALTAVLDSLSAPVPAEDGAPDDRPAEHRRHDALGEACRMLLRSGGLPAAGGVPVTVVLTAPVSEWADPGGHARGPHGQWWRIRDLLPCGDPGCGTEILTVLTNSAGAPLRLGRTRRLASSSQRLALAARDGGCSFPHCARPATYCEAHHITAWRDGGKTDVDNLTLLCGYHHREFARRGWAVRTGGADQLPEWIPRNGSIPSRNPSATTPHVRDPDDGQEVRWSSPVQLIARRRRSRFALIRAPSAPRPMEVMEQVTANPIAPAQTCPVASHRTAPTISPGPQAARIATATSPRRDGFDRVLDRCPDNAPPRLRL